MHTQKSKHTPRHRHTEIITDSYIDTKAGIYKDIYIDTCRYIHMCTDMQTFTDKRQTYTEICRLTERHKDTDIKIQTRIGTFRHTDRHTHKHTYTTDKQTELHRQEQTDIYRLSTCTDIHKHRHTHRHI